MNTVHVFYPLCNVERCFLGSGKKLFSTIFFGSYSKIKVNTWMPTINYNITKLKSSKKEKSFAFLWKLFIIRRSLQIPRGSPH